MLSEFFRNSVILKVKLFGFHGSVAIFEVDCFHYLYFLGCSLTHSRGEGGGGVYQCQYLYVLSLGVSVYVCELVYMSI